MSPARDTRSRAHMRSSPLALPHHALPAALSPTSLSASLSPIGWPLSTAPLDPLSAAPLPMLPSQSPSSAPYSYFQPACYTYLRDQQREPSLIPMTPDPLSRHPERPLGCSPPLSAPFDAPSVSLPTIPALVALSAQSDTASLPSSSPRRIDPLGLTPASPRRAPRICARVATWGCSLRPSQPERARPALLLSPPSAQLSRPRSSPRKRALPSSRPRSLPRSAAPSYSPLRHLPASPASRSRVLSPSSRPRSTHPLELCPASDHLSPMALRTPPMNRATRAPLRDSRLSSKPPRLSPCAPRAPLPYFDYTRALDHTLARPPVASHAYRSRLRYRLERSHLSLHSDSSLTPRAIPIYFEPSYRPSSIYPLEPHRDVTTAIARNSADPNIAQALSSPIRSTLSRPSRFTRWLSPPISPRSIPGLCTLSAVPASAPRDPRCVVARQAPPIVSPSSTAPFCATVPRRFVPLSLPAPLAPAVGVPLSCPHLAPRAIHSRVPLVAPRRLRPDRRYPHRSETG
uniref:Uncharacterized protein n=1 Tax=Knipowitschia caucasica TaxID=637954 RepID=A0AAV2L6Q8_KNICA